MLVLGNFYTMDTHEEANIYVEHNTHPGSQIAHYKNFLTIKARGQNQKKPL